MANDGKYLEDMVQDHFDKSVAGIWCHRFMDSKAARNLGAKQPADFLIAAESSPRLLECKSVKHNFRLKRFVQHSRMVRARMAGINGIILVHHWQLDVYRVFDISKIELGKPSFDLRKICEELDWEEAMERLV